MASNRCSAAGGDASVLRVHLDSPPHVRHGLSYWTEHCRWGRRASAQEAERGASWPLLLVAIVAGPTTPGGRLTSHRILLEVNGSQFPRTIFCDAQPATAYRLCAGATTAVRAVAPAWMSMLARAEALESPRRTSGAAVAASMTTAQLATCLHDDVVRPRGRRRRRGPGARRLS